jgi:hypothetical protein
VTLQKSDGGTTGKLRAGASAFIYAAVSDSGAPAAGVGTLTANVSAFASVSTVTLTPGSWTINGQDYNYRSPSISVKPTLADATYSYSLTVADRAGNGPAVKSSSVVSNSQRFDAAGVSISSGGTVGKASNGDAITLTYNRAPEPSSVLDDWAGDEVPVTVTLVDGNLYGFGSSNDLVGVLDGDGNLLDLGYIATNGEYVASNRTVNFAATMRLTDASVTVTLGNPSSTTNLKTDTSRNVPVWTPGDGAIDEYGNGVSTTPVSGPSSRLF